jgi:hypothetical protein
MDPREDQLYRALAVAKSDEQRAAAWQAFARSGASDGDLAHLRELFATSDPSAVVEYLNEQASERAKRVARQADGLGADSDHRNR